MNQLTKHARHKCLTLATLALAMGASAMTASAAVPTEISDLVTDATSVFDLVKALVIAVVGFAIFIRFVKLVKMR